MLPGTAVKTCIHVSKTGALIFCGPLKQQNTNAPPDKPNSAREGLCWATGRLLSLVS
jgi:hypothetical protein